MMRQFWGWLLFSLSIVGLLLGGLAFAIFLGTVSMLAVNEYIVIMETKGMRPSRRIIRGMLVAFFALACIENILKHIPWTAHLVLPPDFAIAHFPFLLTIGVCISFFRLLFRTENPPASAADIATTILGFVYVGWLPSHLVLLRNLHMPGTIQPANALHQPGLAYVWAALFAIYATDVFAYIIGKRWGKTPLYPQVSPKKTVEGAVGGFLAAIFWCTLVVWLSDDFLFKANPPFLHHIWQGPLMAAVVSIAAQLGDLAESLIKRDAGLKDSSDKLPGHGGFLDRGDGLIFGAAISYYWVYTAVLGII